MKYLVCYERLNSALGLFEEDSAIADGKNQLKTYVDDYKECGYTVTNIYKYVKEGNDYVLCPYKY